MQIGGVEIKRRVLVAAAGAMLATGTWYFWAKSNVPAIAPARLRIPPMLQITGRSAGDLLREQAEFFDPTPLFFPTPQNYGQGRPVAPLGREPAEGFANFDPRLRRPEEPLASYGLQLAPAPQNPKDLLALADAAAFSGFGRWDSPVEPLAGRGGFIEVKALATGSLALAMALEPGALPKVEFAPLEFLILVGTNGLVGEPLMTRNSGSEQVDAFVRDFLVKSFRLGERLAPGKYAVTVGP